MAQDSGFFNAQYQDGEYDRVYNAEQFAAYFASFIGNGIFGNTMDELLPMAANPNNMSVDILSGKAWINGWWYTNDEAYNIPIALADGVLNRKDIIVVRWGNTERDVWLQVIQGEPAIEAVAPTIRRDADYFDLELCEINVPAGTSKITQAQITDTRLDNNVCGLVTGVVDQIDTTNLFIQFQAAYAEWKSTQEADFEDWSEEQKDDFDSWYDAIKNVISESTAYNIFGMITENVEEQAQVSQTYSADDLVVYQEELREVTSTVPQGSVLNDNNSHKIALSTLINRIYHSFSEALTNLKNTAIAQAVGATGTTFTSVIAKLAEIVNRGSVSKTLDVNTTSFTIAQGYHDGTGSVNIVTQEKSVAPTGSSQNIVPDSGKVLSKVVVNAVDTQEKTATPSTSAVTVTPDSGKLLSKVTVSAISPQRNPTTPNQATLTGYNSIGAYVWFPEGWWPAQDNTHGSYVYMTQAQAQQAHQHTGTRATVTSNGTIDLGAIHGTRYVPVAVSGVVGNGTIVYRSVHDDHRSGEAVTYTYTATSAGTYLAIGLEYGGENPSTTGTITFSTTGTKVSSGDDYYKANNRAVRITWGVFTLASGNSVSATCTAPIGQWPCRCLKVFKV